MQLQQGSFTRNADGSVPKEFVTFSLEPVQDFPASKEAGRPIFRDVEFVEIRFPGNNLTVVRRRVTDQDRHQWDRQYAAFKSGGKAPVEGTPLSAWTSVTKAQVREFEAVNIFTVEQLASVSDAVLHTLGIGGRTWRDRARAFMEAATDNAVTDKLASENVTLKEQNELLKRQVEELGQAVAGIKKAMASQQGAPALPDMVPHTSVGESSLTSSDGYVEPVRRGPGRPKKEVA